MHSENSILMKAPEAKIFKIAADLSRWPQILPHYRWITYLEQAPGRNVVIMAARRNVPWLGGAKIPIHWTSEQVIDKDRREIHFYHLKAFTKGMHVVWTFTQSPDGVMVRIVHDLNSNIPVLGKLLVEPVIGGFFIHYIANQTLVHMKKFVENNHGS